MDQLKLKHIVQKKIDESGNTSHWFLIKDRPSKRFDAFIGFKFADGRDGHIVKFHFPKLNYKQRNHNKGLKEKTFGTFELKVPNGKDPESIFHFYERVSGHRSEVEQVEVTSAYQDIVAEEAIYDAIFNKY